MSECLRSSLASGGGAIIGSLFAGDEKAIGITEGTVPHDLLNGELRPVGLGRGWNHLLCNRTRLRK